VNAVRRIAKPTFKQQSAKHKVKRLKDSVAYPAMRQLSGQSYDNCPTPENYG
jgi:hypothetical protein